MPRLSRKERRRLEAQLSASMHQRVKLRSTRDYRRRSIGEIATLAVAGAGGIMVGVFTRPGTTWHELAVAVGAAGVFAAGARLIGAVWKGTSDDG